MVTLHVEGHTLDDALAQISKGKATSAAEFETEALLEELRQRLINQKPPMVVKIEPFETTNTFVTTSGKGGKGKAKAPAASGKVPATTAADTTDDDNGDFAEQGPADDFDNAKEPAEETVPAKFTQDDVRVMLNKHKDQRGLVTSRSIMAKVGGTSKLTEFPEAKYGALIAALNGDMKKAA